MPGSTTLRRGDRGPEVAEAQRLLAKHGYPCRAAGERFTPDYAFGPTTEGSVRAFQQEKGLPRTGVVDAATWRALQGSPHSGAQQQEQQRQQQQKERRGSTRPNQRPTLRQGDRGPDVEEAQELIIALGYVVSSVAGKTMTPDGSFGGTTVKSVKEIQKMAGLPQSGVIDGPTWEVLSNEEETPWYASAWKFIGGIFGGDDDEDDEEDEPHIRPTRGDSQQGPARDAPVIPLSISEGPYVLAIDLDYGEEAFWELRIQGLLYSGVVPRDNPIQVGLKKRLGSGTLTVWPTRFPSAQSAQGEAIEWQVRLYEAEQAPFPAADTQVGAQARLNNLGYLCDGDADLEDVLPSAVRSFQEHQGLPLTGELDDATLGKIKEQYGS